MNAEEIIKELDSLDEGNLGKVAEYVKSLKSLQGCTPDPTGVKVRDLSDIIGAMEPDPEFDEAIASFRKIDQEKWQ